MEIITKIQMKGTLCNNAVVDNEVPFIITRSTRFNVSGYGMEFRTREAEAASALI